MKNVATVFVLIFSLLLNMPDLQAQPVPSPVDVPISNIPQDTPVWCWAAVAQQIIMAIRGPQNTPPQCALVATANGAHPGVCCNGYNPACVRTGSIPQIQISFYILAADIQYTPRLPIR